MLLALIIPANGGGIKEMVAVPKFTLMALLMQENGGTIRDTDKVLLSQKREASMKVCGLITRNMGLANKLISMETHGKEDGNMMPKRKSIPLSIQHKKSYRAIHLMYQLCSSHHNSFKIHLAITNLKAAPLLQTSKDNEAKTNRELA